MGEPPPLDPSRRGLWPHESPLSGDMRALANLGRWRIKTLAFRHYSTTNVGDGKIHRGTSTSGQHRTRCPPKSPTVRKSALQGQRSLNGSLLTWPAFEIDVKPPQDIGLDLSLFAFDFRRLRPFGPQRRQNEGNQTQNNVL